MLNMRNIVNIYRIESSDNFTNYRTIYLQLRDKEKQAIKDRFSVSIILDASFCNNF